MGIKYACKQPLKWPLPDMANVKSTVICIVVVVFFFLVFFCCFCLGAFLILCSNDNDKYNLLCADINIFSYCVKSVEIWW